MFHIMYISENKVRPPKNIDGFLAFHHNSRVTLILKKFVYFTCDPYFIYYHSSISLVSTTIIDNARGNIALECRISMGSTTVNEILYYTPSVSSLRTGQKLVILTPELILF